VSESIAVDRPEYAWAFYVQDADADPPLYEVELYNEVEDREKALFSRVFHLPEPTEDGGFERHTPSDALRLAVAQAVEGDGVPSERMEELPAWEADWLRMIVGTLEEKPDAVPWGVHRGVDDCCAEHRGATESSSLNAYADSDE